MNDNPDDFERPLTYILVDGKCRPVDDPIEWEKRFKEDNPRVALTLIDDIQISTVFLGRDYALEGPPLLFETIIGGGKYDQKQWRYSTLDQARRGHDRVCALIRGELREDEV